VRDIRVAILNLVVDPVAVLERRVLEPLDVGTVSLERLVVLQSDLQRLIDDQRQFARMTVELGDGVAQTRVTGLGPRAEARVRVLPGSEKIPIALDVDQLRIGWLRVPDSLVHWIARTFDPSPQIGRLPIRIQIAPVAIRPGRLEIGVTR
jgi:hypothetical protein